MSDSDYFSENDLVSSSEEEHNEGRSSSGADIPESNASAITESDEDRREDAIANKDQSNTFQTLESAHIQLGILEDQKTLVTAGSRDKELTAAKKEAHAADDEDQNGGPRRRRRVSDFSNFDRIDEMQVQERLLRYYSTIKRRKSDLLPPIKEEKSDTVSLYSDTCESSAFQSSSVSTANTGTKKKREKRKRRVVEDRINMSDDETQSSDHHISSDFSYPPLCRPLRLPTTAPLVTPKNILEIPETLVLVRKEYDSLSTSGAAEMTFSTAKVDSKQAVLRKVSEAGNDIAQFATRLRSSLARQDRQRADILIAENRAQTVKMLSVAKENRTIMPDQPFEMASICGQNGGLRLTTKGQASFLVTTKESALGVASQRSDPETAEAGIIRLPVVLPLPRSSAWNIVRKNYRSTDQAELKMEPYFDDLSGIDTSGFLYFPKARRRDLLALESEVEEEVLRKVVQRFGDSPQVFHEAVSGLPGISSSDAQHKFLEVEKAPATQRPFQSSVLWSRTASDCSEKMKLSSSMKIKQCEPYLISLLKLRHDKFAKESELRRYFASSSTGSTGAVSHYLSRGLPSLGLREGSSYEEIIDSYRELFCRRCYIYDCHMHGAQQPLVRKRHDPVEALSLRLKSAAYGEKDLETISVLSVNSEDYDHEVLKDMMGFDTNARRRSRRSATVHSSKASENDIRGLRRVLIRRMHSEERSNSEPTSQSKRKGSEADVKAEACGSSCYRFQVPEPKASSPRHRQDSWSHIEQHLLSKLLSVIGDDSCTAARCLGQQRTCAEIKTWMAAKQAEDDINGTPTSKPQSRTLRKNANRKSKSKQSSRQASNRRATGRSANMTRDVVPCDHLGDCTAGRECSCVLTGELCHSFCGCGGTCSNKIVGCRCGKGGCSTAGCPCYASGRECDPDLCGCPAAELRGVCKQDDCHGEVHQEEQYSSTASPPSTGSPLRMKLSAVEARESTAAAEPGHIACKNVCFQRGLKKRVAVGRSTVHGWGSFILESAEKNDLIHEYAGELITSEEADRRGLVYDKKDRSFLFDLNDDCVIDAVRMGNKIKFANYLKAPNCYAKILIVKGDHRIGIFAKRDIQAGEKLLRNICRLGLYSRSAMIFSPISGTGGSFHIAYCGCDAGEELTFDYSYSEERAPQWSRQGGTTSPSLHS